MLNYKRILVGLDFSLMDRSLINYVGFLASIIKPNKIYFVHAQELPEVTSLVEELSLELALPKAEELVADMKEEVEQSFEGNEKFDIEYIILKGTPATEILAYASERNIDLLIVGKKKELRGKGIAAQQIVRRIPCSVLFVPEKPRKRLNELFVCNDFSNFSKLALGEAVLLAQANPDATIYCEHVYHIPEKKYRPQKSKQEIKQTILDHNTRLYNECLAEVDTKDVHITPLFTPDNDWPIVKVIKDMAHRKRADLIIIGSKGQSTESTIFIGTTAEKMTREDLDTPLLVVKKREEEFNFARIMKGGFTE